MEEAISCSEGTTLGADAGGVEWGTLGGRADCTSAAAAAAGILGDGSDGGGRGERDFLTGGREGGWPARSSKMANCWMAFLVRSPNSKEGTRCGDDWRTARMSVAAW